MGFLGPGKGQELSQGAGGLKKAAENKALSSSRPYWYETIFQPSSNFWGFMVVFPTTVCLELGKETDHQVRASARSGFNRSTWMRLGWMNPIALRFGYPLM